MRTLVLLAATSLFAPVACDGGEGLPSELLGQWGDTCCGGCVRTFSFSEHEVVYSESCPHSGSGGYSAEVAEVFPDERLFRTTNKMWFGWYRQGATLYLRKTNPGAPRPVLAEGWWSSADFALTAR